MTICKPNNVISVTPTRVLNFVPCRHCPYRPCPPSPDPGPGPGPGPDPDGCVCDENSTYPPTGTDMVLLAGQVYPFDWTTMFPQNYDTAVFLVAICTDGKSTPGVELGWNDFVQRQDPYIKSYIEVHVKETSCFKPCNGLDYNFVFPLGVDEIPYDWTWIPIVGPGGTVQTGGIFAFYDDPLFTNEIARFMFVENASGRSVRWLSGVRDIPECSPVRYIPPGPCLPSIDIVTDGVTPYDWTELNMVVDDLIEFTGYPGVYRAETNGLNRVIALYMDGIVQTVPRCTSYTITPSGNPCGIPNDIITPPTSVEWDFDWSIFPGADAGKGIRFGWSGSGAGYFVMNYRQDGTRTLKPDYTPYTPILIPKCAAFEFGEVYCEHGNQTQASPNAIHVVNGVAVNPSETTWMFPTIITYPMIFDFDLSTEPGTDEVVLMYDSATSQIVVMLPDPTATVVIPFCTPWFVAL